MEPEVAPDGRKYRSDVPAGPPGHLFDGVSGVILTEIADQAPELNDQALEYKLRGPERARNYLGWRLYEKTRQELHDAAEKARKEGKEYASLFVAEEWPEWADVSETQKEVWRDRAFRR